MDHRTVANPLRLTFRVPDADESPAAPNRLNPERTITDSPLAHRR
ncbi:hypothetical protein GCM10011519_05590 [Marmoricola endophyticus]|uniref:Uncharacterized protein n=1 Tax=Marmoricola endophyticus TaxID=2040280 RepID=A0A917BD98_9ACTN|nr:hypothetical protein [Marmoricola endophyticus]GGF35017.1 hypothetical protein GCM10011519_05590 [Marmoricola endophyticus]